MSAQIANVDLSNLNSTSGLRNRCLMLPTQLFWSVIVLKLKSFNFAFSNIQQSVCFSSSSDVICHMNLALVSLKCYFIYYSATCNL